MLTHKLNGDTDAKLTGSNLTGSNDDSPVDPTPDYITVLPHAASQSHIIVRMTYREDDYVIQYVIGKEKDLAKARAEASKAGTIRGLEVR